MITIYPQTKLGEVLKLQDNSVPVTDLSEVDLAGVYSFAKGLFKRGPIVPAQTSYKYYNRLITNDYVISQPKAWEGALARVTPEFEGWYLSPVFPTFRPIANRLEPKYLEWYCRRTAVWAELQRKSHGLGARRESVSPEQFLSLEIPLPPISEQRRIVARIEALSVKIEEALALKSRSTSERQVILASTRNRFFSRIAHDIRPVRIDSVADCRLGKMLSRNQTNDGSGTPYVRNANVQWDRLDLTSVYRINVSKIERDELELREGDILVCEGGDIGKSAIWNCEIPGCIFQKALHRIRVDRTKLVPRFLLNHIFWAAEQGHFHEIKTQTTIAHLTGVKLKAYPVYVPSIKEQNRFIDYLNDLQNRVDAAKKLQEESEVELNALMPSILSKAFAGEI